MEETREPQKKIFKIRSKLTLLQFSSQMQTTEFPLLFAT